jgi:hypothetical protein
MKLKYLNINGHGVLVDESVKIKEGDTVFDNYAGIHNIQKVRTCDLDSMHYKNGNWNKIIFAEKELNLNVPILPNWREWEVEQEAKQYSIKRHKVLNYELEFAFLAGYNHNKAKYTEEDLRKAIEIAKNSMGVDNCGEVCYSNKSTDSIIQSLQKVPKYIVMESIFCSKDEEILRRPHTKNDLEEKPKLITNSEGKQEGIIKEIIYDN